MPRYFTLDEANAVLEEIKPLMARIIELGEQIQRKSPEVWPMVKKSAGNGGNEAASRLVAEFKELNDLVHTIQASGVLIKDLNTGLIDFLSLREGREIYLCWKHGEDKIRFWHDLDAGFAGRQPL